MIDEIRKLSNKNEENKNFNISDELLRKSEFIGYDIDHNSYWRSAEKINRNYNFFIFVYSSKGEIIEAFYFYDLKDHNALNGKKIHTAVAPNGDVYFMRNDENGSHFWKVERRW